MSQANNDLVWDSYMAAAQQLRHVSGIDPGSLDSQQLRSFAVPSPSIEEAKLGFISRQKDPAKIKIMLQSYRMRLIILEQQRKLRCDPEESLHALNTNMVSLLLLEKGEELYENPEMTQRDYEMLSTLLPQLEEIEPQDPEREKRAKEENEMQLMLLEELNRKRPMMARQEKD